MTSASAQVVLRSASGRRLDPGTPITSANVAEFAPSAEDVREAQAAFAAAGFETGPMVGISFSITGPLALFERIFHTALEAGSGGAVGAAGRTPPPGGLELPLGALPRDLADRLIAVAFTPPAELYGGGGRA